VAVALPGTGSKTAPVEYPVSPIQSLSDTPIPKAVLGGSVALASIN